MRSGFLICFVSKGLNYILEMLLLSFAGEIWELGIWDLGEEEGRKRGWERKGDERRRTWVSVQGQSVIVNVVSAVMVYTIPLCVSSVASGQ